MCRSIIRLRISALLLIVLLGCQPSLSGEWRCETSDLVYEFEQQDRVKVSALGTTTVARYQIVGDQIFLTSPQGTVMLTYSNGILYGPMGQRYERWPPSQ